MKAFDTEILTEILSGNPAYAERIANVPLDEQVAPIVAVEEIIRGRADGQMKSPPSAQEDFQQAYSIWDAAGAGHGKNKIAGSHCNRPSPLVLGQL
jgi:hypothetical protein